MINSGMQTKETNNMTMQFNGPSQDLRPISTLKEMLDTSAELYAKKPAFLIKKEKGSTYREINYTLLKHDVDSLGTKLMDLGLQNEKIAVIGANCYEWIVAYLAISNGTGVVVPLDKELSQEEIDHLLEVSQCKGVFFTGSYESYFKEKDIPVKVKMKVFGDRTDIKEPLQTTSLENGIFDWTSLVKDGEALLEEGNRKFLDAEIDPDEMRILLFTSGTTESAKGVMLSQRNIAANIVDTCKVAHIYPEDRTLSILPIHHTFECTLGQLLMIYRGASTAYYEGLKYVVKNLVEAKATVLIGVPLIFESIYGKIWKKAEKSGKAELLRRGIKINRAMNAMGINVSKKIFKDIHNNFGGKLRLIISGAAGLDPNVCRGFEDFGFRVLQGYGLTECSPLVSGPPDYCNTYKKAGSVGPSVDSGEICIIKKDENGIGEILFKGPNVMLGYYNMPEKTAEVIKDGWFHTGDLGFLDNEGWLYITGRKKNVIVTKTGKNIYPEEVEMYINRNQYIQESLVHGMEKEEDTLVSAQIRPAYDVIYEEFGKDYREDDIQSLMKKAMKEVNEGLPIYKRIRDFKIRTDEFVKTTTKKIKRYENV